MCRLTIGTNYFLILRELRPQQANQHSVRTVECRLGLKSREVNTDATEVFET